MSFITFLKEMMNTTSMLASNTGQIKLNALMHIALLLSLRDGRNHLIGFFLSKRIVTPRLSSYVIEHISSMFIGILETTLLQSGHFSTTPRLLKHTRDQWQKSHNYNIISGNFSPLILCWTVLISSVGIILVSGDSLSAGKSFRSTSLSIC